MELVLLVPQPVSILFTFLLLLIWTTTTTHGGKQIQNLFHGSGGGQCNAYPDRIPTFRLSSPSYTNCRHSIENIFKKKNSKTHTEKNKRSPQIFETSRYPYETYNITTRDGYILTVYRITGSPRRSGKHKGRKQAVYLNHGLGGASDCWNFQSGNRNLPYKLADGGYDVWIGNSRGNTYSLRHAKYNANRDLEYWNFSFHEMGIYDVPAVIDKIIQITRNQKIFYVGHSATEYFVALSEIPRMNEKVLAGFLMAPTAHIGHTSSPFRLLVPLLGADSQFRLINAAMEGRFKNAQDVRSHLKVSPSEFCDPSAVKCGVCDNLMFLLFGFNAHQININELPHIMEKYPNNISVKTMAHYAQLVASCEFKKYEHGYSPRVKYGGDSGAVSEYNLKNIRAPTYFFYGEQDNFATPTDVNITARNLRSGVLKGVYKVKGFTHSDFILSKDADKLVYNRILTEMRRYK